jgi:hypothetical protein
MARMWGIRRTIYNWQESSCDNPEPVKPDTKPMPNGQIKQCGLLLFLPRWILVIVIRQISKLIFIHTPTSRTTRRRDHVPISLLLLQLRITQRKVWLVPDDKVTVSVRVAFTRPPPAVATVWMTRGLQYCRRALLQQ